jgi:hypothetical protein
MKRSLIIGFLLLLSVSLSAQRLFQKPLKSQKQGTNLAFSDYTIGVKLGCPWSLLLDSEISNVTYSGNIGYSLGLVVEHYYSRFSIGLEGLFSQKGTRMFYEMPYQLSLDPNDIKIFRRDFFFGYNLISVRIPLTYYFKGVIKDDKVVPYLFVAPQIDIPLNFNATIRKGEFLFEPSLSQTTTTTYESFIDERQLPVDKNALLNISALGGVGFMARIPTESSAIIIKFDLAANFGLRNLAEEGFIWKKDKDKLVRKENNHIIRSHDIEANLTILFPIKRRLRDACYSFDKK